LSGEKKLGKIQSQDIEISIQEAKKNILLGAAADGGKFKEIDQGGAFVLKIDGTRYGESEEQRLLYFYALERLIAAEDVESDTLHGPCGGGITAERMDSALKRLAREDFFAGGKKIPEWRESFQANDHDEWQHKAIAAYPDAAKVPKDTKSIFLSPFDDD